MNNKRKFQKRRTSKLIDINKLLLSLFLIGVIFSMSISCDKNKPLYSTTKLTINLISMPGAILHVDEENLQNIELKLSDVSSGKKMSYTLNAVKPVCTKEYIALLNLEIVSGLYDIQIEFKPIPYGGGSKHIHISAVSRSTAIYGESQEIDLELFSIKY